MPGEDVIVVGGGPAGSTAATLLARRGFTVLLLEREHFPREHIGESLLPASLPLLEELGVLPAMDAAGFVKKWGAVMVWGTSSEPWSWYFRETNRRYPHAYQVRRAEFDQLLLMNAATRGVAVREGCRVLAVLFDGGRATGVRYIAEDGSRQAASARFVVDASGRTGLAGRSMGLRHADPAFRNLAVYGYFCDVVHLPEPDGGSIFIEAYPEGWCWTIPLAGNRYSVGAVVDSAQQQPLIRREGREAFFRRQLKQAPNTARRLSAAALVSGPMVAKDWSYSSSAVAGDGWVLAGDAACFVDPLFSSGVHLAMSSGLMAAAYVTTALTNPALREAAACSYQTLYAKQYGHFRELARLFYGSNRSVESYFWEARRITGADESRSPRLAFIEAVAGQPPQGYERVVLDRGEAPSDFVEGVRSVEAGRSTRRVQLQAAFDTRSPRRFERLVPRLAAGVTLDRRAILGDGAFVMSDVLLSPGRPEGLPLSPLLAEAVALMDGHRSAAELLAALRAAHPPARAEQIASAVLPALQLLYVDGAVEELQGLT